MTATRIDSSSGTGGTGLAGYYDITAYGASTGATDNGPAINSAVTAAKAGKGKVYVPPGTFKFSTPIVLDTWEGGGIVGVGDNGGEVGAPRSELRFTGTGARAISCRSIFGFTIRGLLFTYDNSGGNFTGDFIDVDGSLNHADCTNFAIVGCGSHHLSTITARSIVRMNQAINGIVKDCGWAGATNCLRLGEPGGSYVVGIRVTNCTFNLSNDAHIFIGSGDAENISIDFCRFEASTNTTGIRVATTAVDGANGVLYDCEISNNWFGDAGAPTNWITGLRAIFNGAITVRANYFAEAGAGGTHVGCDPTTGVSLNLFGNHFEGGGNVFNANVNSRVVMIGNTVNSPTNLCNSGGDRPIYMTSFGNVTPGGTTSNTAYDMLSPRIALGIGAASSSFPGDSLDAGPTGKQEQLVLGAYATAGLKALGAKAGIYTRVKGGDPGVLALQAATSDNTHEVQVVGGTTPTPQVRVSGVGVAFNNVAPVAQAARAGQLTDSTGGTVTSTLAAGITDAVAKNAIASLAAKVNALETIIHNSGLSA